MILRRLAITTFALFLAPLAFGPTSASAEPMPQQPNWQRGGWDTPPPQYSEVERLGFHDGIEGARRDFGNHRQPSPNNRDEYRSPHVAWQLRDAYRAAFRRGYEVAASRLWGGVQPGPVAGPPQLPPPPPSGGWDWGMRGLRSDAARQGFREGTEHARQDFYQRRRPDPDDHREYRNPPVPPPLVDEYRIGFMRGYEVAMSQLSGEGQWQGGDPRRFMPGRFSDIQRRGFHDGIDGANKDYGNGRAPNPVNRDEYRSPHLPPQLWDEYREGFRRGYEVAAMRLWGGR